MRKFLFLLFLIYASVLFSQGEDLRIYGYMQAYGAYFSNYIVEYPVNPLLGNDPNKPGKFVKEIDYKPYFTAQQLNLFFTKNFRGRWGDFTAFVNLEATNNFSAKQNFGNFKVEEVFGKYGIDEELNIKFGYFIPPFNNLNEIKNRMPLLPFLFRPTIYESYINEINIVIQEDFVPQKANIQIYGGIPLSSDITFNYALYGGNAEQSYYSNQALSIFPAGIDTSKYKLLGGRIGLESYGIPFIADQDLIFKVGISGTYDRDNRNKYLNQSILNNQTQIASLGVAGLTNLYLAPIDGNLQRYRLGADFSFTISGLTIEGEVVHVKYFNNDPQIAYMNKYRDNLQNALLLVGGAAKTLQMEILANPTSPDNAVKVLRLSSMQSFIDKARNEFRENITVGKEFDKQFYYISANYNITEDFQIYVSYDFSKDLADLRLDDQVHMFYAGLNWKPTYAFVFKLQYARQEVKKINYLLNSYFFGASLYF